MAYSRSSLGLVALGALVILASFIWRCCDQGKSAWSADKAARLQEAQSTLHKLADHGESTHARSASPPADPREQREYKEALAEHQSLRADLEYAQNRGEQVATWLLWGGVALVAAGWLGGKVRAGNQES